MIHLPVAQGSEEWHMARCGLPTASRFDKIVTKKGVLSKSETSRNFMYYLLAEIITGQPTETYQSAAMNRGTDMEAQAVAAFELERSVDMEVCGLCLTDDERVGASLDRLKLSDSERRGLQVKCPFEPYIHVSYLDGNLVEKHKAQVQGEILVAELDYEDIISYHPDYPMACVRVYPDKEYQKTLREALEVFTADFAALVERAHERGWIKEPAPEPEVGDLGITDKDVEAVVAAVKAGKE